MSVGNEFIIALFKLTFVGIILTIANIALVVPVNAALTDGLVGYWK